ncbi:MAG: hypothetical protein ACJAVN_002037 [Roseivirga sp.]|jgi:hypothetical protein
MELDCKMFRQAQHEKEAFYNSAQRFFRSISHFFKWLISSRRRKPVEIRHSERFEVGETEGV